MTPVEQVVGAMDTVAFAEIEDMALADRVSSKYVFGRRHLPELLESIAAGYRVLAVDGNRWSALRALYFDTVENDYFLQHHNGKPYRPKYRIRKYVASSVCYLEIKVKTSKSPAVKERIPIEDPDEDLSADLVRFFESVPGAPSDLTPRLWNRFSRITLASHGLTERVTFDVDLEFGFEDRTANLPSIVIAEVKQHSDSHHSAIREALRLRRIRPMKVSKYWLGTALVRPELKSNRFKRKLTRIQSIT